MELTTWFPGYEQSLSQIRSLLRQLAAEKSVPPEARDDLVLAGSEAAAYLLARSGVREVQLRWNSWNGGATLELEVDGILPVFEQSNEVIEPFPLIKALTQEASVEEHIDGRPRTTVHLVRCWPPTAGRIPIPRAV